MPPQVRCLTGHWRDVQYHPKLAQAVISPVMTRTLACGTGLVWDSRALRLCVPVLVDCSRDIGLLTTTTFTQSLSGAVLHTFRQGMEDMDLENMIQSEGL